jgi:hypothetical protein
MENATTGPVRAEHHTNKTRKCIHCHSEYILSREDKMHCSATCRHLEWRDRKNKKQEMESKTKKASFSEIMTHLVTGLVMSFGGVTAKKAEEKPEPKAETKQEPLVQTNTNTYVIIYKERERKGLFKWLVSLFW